MGQATKNRAPWRPPAFVDEMVDEDEVRKSLLAQHGRLRGMLDVVDADAVALIRAGTCSCAELARAFDRIAGALEEHVHAEERALSKLLPPTPAARRALELLRDEHERQRAELHAMSRLASASDDGISLALAIRAFVNDLRLDMDLEDRRFLTGLAFDDDEPRSTG